MDDFTESNPSPDSDSTNRIRHRLDHCDLYHIVLCHADFRDHVRQRATDRASQSTPFLAYSGGFGQSVHHNVPTTRGVVGSSSCWCQQLEGWSSLPISVLTRLDVKQPQLYTLRYFRCDRCQQVEITTLVLLRCRIDFNVDRRQHRT